MSTSLIGKRILFLCDNDDLAQAIVLRLDGGVEIVRCGAQGEGTSNIEAPAGRFDLVVLVASSPASEPAAMLFETSLLEQLGQIPFLIVSHRRFNCEPGDKVQHLQLPLAAGELYDAVQAILQR